MAMHPKNAMILRTHVGEATGPDGTVFEMSLANGYIPAVKDKTTGKTWTLGWDEIVAQAVAAGVSIKERDIAHEQELAASERADNGGVNSGKRLS